MAVVVFFMLATWSTPLFYSTIGEWVQSWQKAVFSHVCHQQPVRSFAIQGVPLAVCSRCTGIYSGLFLGVVLFSNFTAFLYYYRHFIIRVFIAASMVVVADGLANLTDMWQTPNHARSMIGLFWGTTTGLLLVYALLIPRKHKCGDFHNGTI